MSKGLDVYKDVWVAITYGDTVFYKVYLDKKDAILEAHETNESRKNMIFNSKPRECKVKSLADAIDWIKEAIEDERIFNEWNN